MEPAVVSNPIATSDRLKFAHFDIERLVNGRCRADVRLTHKDGAEYQGESAGLASQAGELRCAAQACVNALAQSVDGKVKFDLLGVKAVRVFDSTVVIVSLAAHNGEESHRLVGCCLTEKDPARGAALAVLNATNRILGNMLFMR